MSLRVNIDTHSGFCFGVRKAIDIAEEVLQTEKKLYCLGEIVHNSAEVERLEQKGLIAIDYKWFTQLKDCTVLLRAHGEPPETYRIARENNITLIDATCPVVRKFQQKVANDSNEIRKKQVVIYGKKEHPEVIGLVGHTNNKAIVLGSEDDLDKLTLDKDVVLFAQTTMNTEAFNQMEAGIRTKLNGTASLEVKNTICGSVANRQPVLEDFARRHDVILFVGGKSSSNGKMLFNICKAVNSMSYYISKTDEIDLLWFRDANFVGVCGATSTPAWLMEEVAAHVRTLNS